MPSQREQAFLYRICPECGQGFMGVYVDRLCPKCSHRFFEKDSTFPGRNDVPSLPGLNEWVM